jgi:hypothetical protein
VVFAPAPDVVAYAGTSFMNGDHAVDIVRETFFSTGRQILAIKDRTLLDPLLSRKALAS